MALLGSTLVGCSSNETGCPLIGRTSFIATFMDATSGEGLCPEVQVAHEGGPPEIRLLDSRCRLVGPTETFGSFTVDATLDGYEPASLQLEVGSAGCAVTEYPTLEMEPIPPGGAG